MTYFSGDTAAMAAYAAKTRAIGEEINAQVQSSIGAVQGLSSSWKGKASRTYEGTEILRQDKWGRNTDNVNHMSDNITQVHVNYSDVDNEWSNAIGSVIN
ncbi:WXG100 family type VII secretion target [Amycolatopsis sp. WAC 04169]|uniref:WXG100 family type VII secretion target n=1 Tax=Amycolatopsis sp. WAC 04169 TaxID=2203197 RepID=UPI00131540E8|nr:WXG100 family type VII secretion target [Amycolatopsis sp. WAC 04169]